MRRPAQASGSPVHDGPEGSPGRRPARRPARVKIAREPGAKESRNPAGTARATRGKHPSPSPAAPGGPRPIGGAGPRGAHPSVAALALGPRRGGAAIPLRPIPRFAMRGDGCCRKRGRARGGAGRPGFRRAAHGNQGPDQDTELLLPKPHLPAGRATAWSGRARPGRWARWWGPSPRRSGSARRGSTPPGPARGRSATRSAGRRAGGRPGPRPPPW